MKYAAHLYFSIGLALLCHAVAAQTVYVDPAGDDRHSGSAEAPLATLGGAVKQLRLLKGESSVPVPATVIVRSGTYFMPETLELLEDDGGTEQQPLVFRGEGPQPPVFYGGVRLAPFRKISDSLWVTEVPQVKQFGWRIEQLYVNGSRVPRARTPNSGFYQPLSVTETVILQGAGRAPEMGVQKVKVPAEVARLLADLNEEALQQVVVTFYHHWDNTKKIVQRYSAADTAIYLVGSGMKPWNPINTRSTFVLENLQAALDEEGEWFLHPSGKLYYRPRPDETLESTTAIAPSLDKFIVIRGNEKTGKRASDIRFENLAFRVSGYVMPASGVEPAQAAAPIGAAIEIDFASRVAFVNCELSSTGGHGIWFRRACDNGLVEQCYLHDLGGGAVKIGETRLRNDTTEITHHIRVVNNIARSGGHVFPCAVAMIIFHGHDNEILHNDIADFTYSGVSVGWVWGYSHSPSKRNKVEYNHIHHLGWGVLSDMGGVYTLGKSEGTSVSNNRIHDIYSRDYGGWGLYTDEGSEGVVMENNLVYNCKSAGFHQHYGRDNIIRNNIFVNSIKSQLQATRVEPHRSFSFTNNIVYFNEGTLLSSNWATVNQLSDYNCYWDARGVPLMFGKKTFAEWKKEGKDEHSVNADPKFRDAANDDFHPTSRQLIRRIGFKPFDQKKAGVYGDEQWVQKAAFDPARAEAFRQMVRQHEGNR